MDNLSMLLKISKSNDSEDVASTIYKSHVQIPFLDTNNSNILQRIKNFFANLNSNMQVHLMKISFPKTEVMKKNQQATHEMYLKALK